MNCPVCTSGMLELVGDIVLKQGPLEMRPHKEQYEHVLPFLEIRICSRGNCGHVVMTTMAPPQEQPIDFGFIELKPGPLEMKTGVAPEGIAAIEIGMDGARGMHNVIVKAAPDSLSLVKKKFREELYRS